MSPLRINILMVLLLSSNLQQPAASQISGNCNRIETVIITSALRLLAERVAPAGDVSIMRRIGKEDFDFRFNHLASPFVISNTYHELQVEAMETPGGHAPILCSDIEERCPELEEHGLYGYTYFNGTRMGPRNLVMALVDSPGYERLGE